MPAKSCCALSSRARRWTKPLSDLVAPLCRPTSPRGVLCRRTTSTTTRRCSPTNQALWWRPPWGLHFTPSLIGRLPRLAGVVVHRVTLHVGAGTFAPVRGEDTRDHKMHSEWGSIDAATAEALNAVREAGGRIVCVGTTSARVLESAADEDGRLRPFSGDTDIFITPGYEFRCVDVLVTNFHLPRSTLFMLVSAFSGLETMRAAYAHAIETGYRFYSYGDACLLTRAGVSTMDAPP